MSEKPLATPRGSHADNENSRLECQTGTAAHAEPKGQFGEVSNPAWLAAVKAYDKLNPFLTRDDHEAALQAAVEKYVQVTFG